MPKIANDKFNIGYKNDFKISPKVTSTQGTHTPHFPWISQLKSSWKLTGMALWVDREVDIMWRDLREGPPS